MNASRAVTACLLSIVSITLTACGDARDQTTPDGLLSPANWSAATQQRLLQHESGAAGEPKPRALGAEAMIAGSTSPRAIGAGLQALRHGGSSVDAAATTALAQVALVAGSYVSYAGFMTMLHYDAATGEVHSLNGGFNTIGAETAPMTIPAAPEPSGRTALVPGFFAGLQAAHDRFGRLPWKTLFEPSIHFAEEGFTVTRQLAAFIRTREDVLMRLPEARRIFTNVDGEFFAQGDRFRQPELAVTLRRVADEGAEYVYRGPWAEQFVEIVRREGGKVTLADLSAYAPIWSDPVHTRFHDYDVYSLGAPNAGGVNLVEALNVAELVDWKALGPYTENVDALQWLLRIANISLMMGMDGVPPAAVVGLRDGIDTSREARLSKDNARRIWEGLRDGDGASVEREQRSGGHSDAVVAVDRDGNLTVLVHTINSAIWGHTGIFVDGISIPDSAKFQQRLIAHVGPGQRLPDPSSPHLVMRNGRPVLAGGSIGMALHNATLIKLINVFEYGMDAKAANEAPEFGSLNAFAPGVFSDELIDKLRERGQNVRIIEPPQQMPYGHWTAIALDPETGTLSGTAPVEFNGMAEGF